MEFVGHRLESLLEQRAKMAIHPHVVDAHPAGELPKARGVKVDLGQVTAGGEIAARRRNGGVDTRIEHR
jgi:hypothetical protein